MSIETNSDKLSDMTNGGLRFAGLGEASGTGARADLERIADKIGSTRRPGARSDIPAGSTYLAQLVIHDLDFQSREGTPESSLLDLGILYGDGPRHDVFCYQVPAGAGVGRHLLRIGRTRPTPTSPAWGAARDLPRAACPDLDARGVESRTEVLVPNAFSDSNALLAQVQTVWALMHNAIAGKLAATRTADNAFVLARRINRGIYRDVIRQDVLGTWLMPGLRERYCSNVRFSRLIGRAPREFMAGVGRLGHGMVREIYSLNDQSQVMGLRNIIRHTSTGRPHEMPLTEDWLLDFSRFFKIGASVPQRARALGPHVARPIATGAGVAVGTPAAESLVLRDLFACTRGDLLSVRSLIARARGADVHVFEGCFAQDEDRWIAAMSDWLSDTGIAPDRIATLAADPPLTLFLMIEAEEDTAGRTLGALGSILMGETLCAALPDADHDSEIDEARASVFPGGVPGSMSDMTRFLQDHYRFVDGARLHSEEPPAEGGTSTQIGETTMFDVQDAVLKPISRIEVADYIEMGRLVTQWTVDPDTRPKTVAELTEQFDGIAVVPERIKHVEFVQSTLDTLVLRLPVKEMLAESVDKMSDPMGDGRYPLPQFYADHYRPGFGPVMTPLDTLLARVGDYTIAQCK